MQDSRPCRRSIAQVSWILVLAALVLSVGSGCADRAPQPDVAARLDGEEILYDEFEGFLVRSSVEAGTVLGSDVLSRLLDQFLEERLLQKLAADTLQLDERVDGREAVRALLAAHDVGVIDEASVVAHYERHRRDYERPESVYLRQLLLTDREVADRLRGMWAAGVPYEEVLDRFADDESLHVGQEGEFTRSDLPAAVAETLFSLRPGEVSEVLAADYGFHVFQVLRHVPPGSVPLSEVAESIRLELESRRRDELLSDLVNRARRRYNVRVFERNVPFNYVGEFESNRAAAR